MLVADGTFQFIDIRAKCLQYSCVVYSCHTLSRRWGWVGRMVGRRAMLNPHTNVLYLAEAWIEKLYKNVIIPKLVTLARTRISSLSHQARNTTSNSTTHSLHQTSSLLARRSRALVPSGRCPVWYQEHHSTSDQVPVHHWFLVPRGGNRNPPPAIPYDLLKEALIKRTSLIEPHQIQRLHGERLGIVNLLPFYDAMNSSWGKMSV